MFKTLGDTIHIWCIGETNPYDSLSLMMNLNTSIVSLKTNGSLRPAYQYIACSRTGVGANTITQSENTNDAVCRKEGRGRETFRQITGNLQDGIWFPGAEDYLAYAFDLRSPIHTLNDRSLIVLPSE